MNKEDPELILGRMRCLEALGEWYISSSSICRLFVTYHYPRNLRSHWFVADAALFICRISFQLVFLFWGRFFQVTELFIHFEPWREFELLHFRFIFSSLDIFPLSRGNLFLTRLDIIPLRIMWKGLDSADQSSFSWISSSKRRRRTATKPHHTWALVA